VNKKVFALVLAFTVLCMSVFVFDVNAQKGKPRAPRTTLKTKAVDPMLGALPQSDIVVSIDVKRLLNEFIPKLLSESPDKLALFNAQMDKIKSESGFDLRQIERIVAGLRLIRTSPTKLNVEAVALAKSSYNANAIISGGKMVSNGKFKEEKYAGKTIVLFDLSAIQKDAAEAIKGDTQQPADPNQPNAQPQNKSFVDKLIDTILGQDLKEVAVTAIDEKTIAIGKLSSVKAMLDVKTGAKSTNAAINNLALKNPNAVVSFGGNVPEKVSALIDDNTGNEFLNQLDAIKQLYGSIGMSAANYEVAVSARTINATKAKELFDVLQFLKQFGGGFLQGRNDELSKIGAGVLEGLKTKNEGKDVHLKIEMKQSDINGLLKLF